MCDNDKVFLYSMDGRQIRQIGQAGRARFEYNRPSIVRVQKDTVYVWSSMTLKFISYLMDGTPLRQYRYDSAITNFDFSGDYIFISTAGRSDDHLVDVYDTKERTVVKRLVESSEEHKCLLLNYAASPLYVTGEYAYFSPRSSLDVYRYDIVKEENILYSSIDSDTFSVKQGTPDMLRDKKRIIEYLSENSEVMSIFTDSDGKIYVLSYEGYESMKEEGGMDKSGRFYTLYEAGKDRPIAQYTYDSIGTELLFDSTSDELYFIRHTIEKAVHNKYGKCRECCRQNDG